MTDFLNLGIAVLASGISFLLGISLRTIADRYRVRKARQFWGPAIARDKTVIFLGAFPSGTFPDPTNEEREFEPTGLVGLGDARAVHELTSYLTDLGVSVEMAYTNEQSGGRAKQNVILLGAEDVNQLVRRPFHDVPSTLRFETSRECSSLHDDMENHVYRAEWEEGQILCDYGRLIRTSNPYGPGRTLVMICGLYGFGTWGGVRLLSDREFLRQCASFNGGFDIECVYEVQVYQGEPEFVTPIAVRALKA